MRFLGDGIVADNPGSVDAHFFVGWAHLQRNQYGAAEEALRRAVELDPKREEAFVLLAQVRGGLGTPGTLHRPIWGADGIEVDRYPFYESWAPTPTTRIPFLFFASSWPRRRCWG